MPSLVMKEGPLAGQRFPVAAQVVLGRVDADLPFEDPLVSRRHALVRQVAGALEIEDLGSLNGTWVNGDRIAEARRLRSGDVIRLGSVVLEVEGDSAAGGGTVLAPAPPARPESGRDAAPMPADAPSTGRPPAPVHEDELRPVTALFADVVGSTTLGERLAPHEVKVVIGECVSRMTRAVEQFGGLVQAYMGDGVAAFFGVPRAHEDDAERAARAALRILEDMREYAREVEEAWGIADFAARIGINTGEAAVGLVGASDPQSVSLGDTANVASRLQSAANPGSIVAGAATAKTLLHKFVLDPLGDVTVKGRSQPVEAWRLVEAQASVRAPAATPLVGREAEMARLTTALDELSAGRGQIVFFLGEAGIGKTRLLGEVRALAADRGTWLEGHCYSYGTDLVYGPFIQMLRSWLGAEEGEPELSVRTKLYAKLGLLPASEGSNLAPYLSRLLSLKLDPTEEERLSRLTPHELAARIRKAYCEWVTSLSRQSPVVIALEDIHWADHSSCQLAEDLLQLVELTPVLLLATLRVDPESEGWGFRVHVLADNPHRVVDLRLSPLPDNAARLLLRAIPRSRELREPDLDLIVAGAEGNPLYLEELVTAFADTDGVLAGQTWIPTTSGTKVLTPTLESLLLARMDALPASTRRLAQLAAVIGRSFPLRVLEHVADAADVNTDLAALLRADVIRELHRYPETEYTFRHGLLRQACLSTLPPAARHKLYGAVGTAFETLFAATIDDHLEVIAHYFARSDQLVKALAYLERAGERAAALDAEHRAVQLWERALRVAEKLSDPDARGRVESRLAAVAGSSDPAGDG